MFDKGCIRIRFPIIFRIFVSEGEDAFFVCDGRLFNKIIQELIRGEQSLVGSFVFNKVKIWFWMLLKVR